MSLPSVRKRSTQQSAFAKPLEDNVAVHAFRGGILPELNEGMPRLGHTIVVYKQDMYLYGGCGPKNTYPNDIYCNSKMTLQWKEMRGAGVVPHGRGNHTAVIYENKMIVFGGNRNLDVLDDLCIVNLDTMRWERIAYEKGQGPGPVFSHSAVYIPPTRTMFVIGGFHQRLHNMYLAHTFDVRHRVWNGVRGPLCVNPHHIQLCHVAYYAQGSSIVVVGVVERDVLTAGSCELPTVFLMNIYTCAWVEVTTVTNPESPIPFRMDGVWEYFIRDSITMGGVFDEKQQEWYFPLLLTPVEKNLMRRKTHDRVCSITSISTDPKAKKKGTAYGFLRLQMNEMTWSIIPARFPKRVLMELAARRVSKLAIALERQSRHRKSKEIVKKRPPLLFSAAGVSRFQHKYAFAVVEPSGAQRLSSGKKYIVMHGGIGPDDYAMLLFAPMLKRQGATQGDFVAFSESNEASLSISRTPSVDQSIFTLDDEHSETDSEFSRVVPGNEQPYAPSAETDPNILVGRLHRLESDPTILPTLFQGRSGPAMHRFAVLYHNLSAVQSDKLLPDPGCPVAVLDKESDVKSWAENVYSETRQWIAKNIKQARVEDRLARRGKKRASRGSKTDENGEDFSSDTDSEPSRRTSEVKLVPREIELVVPRVKDFFKEKNLDLFNLSNFELRRNSLMGKSLMSTSSTPDSIQRLRMTVKRNEEVQRLPSTIFQRSSLGNLTDLGGAMAYVLMESGLRRYEDDQSPTARQQRALIRWRYLRTMVLNGEAAAIVHRANHEEARGKGFRISSSNALTLAPDLHTKGPQTRKVPTRPIPYTVPRLPTHSVRSSEMTPSGMVMYHCVKHVNQ